MDDSTGVGVNHFAKLRVSNGFGIDICFGILLLAILLLAMGMIDICLVFYYWLFYLIFYLLGYFICYWLWEWLMLGVAMGVNHTVINNK